MSVHALQNSAPDIGLRVLVLGGNSAIAVAAARLYAAGSARIVLAGRDATRLETVAQDLRLRGAAAVVVETCDLAEDAGASRLGVMSKHFGGFDHVLLAYGVLGEQHLAQENEAETARILKVNLVSAAQWANAVAASLEAQGQGSLVVIGSVAGDRGKRSNYVYGASKAGLEVLVQGIAHRFAGRPRASQGLRVALVKPGPTDTPMTAGMNKAGPLWSGPEAVARVVRAAADRGGVAYAPARWRLLMLLLRSLPRPVWNRLDI